MAISMKIDQMAPKPAPRFPLALPPSAPTATSPQSVMMHDRKSDVYHAHVMRVIGTVCSSAT